MQVAPVVFGFLQASTFPMRLVYFSPLQGEHATADDDADCGCLGERGLLHAF